MRENDHKTRLLDDYGQGFADGQKHERERQVTLTVDRDWLGRMVRHAWVEWAKTQDAPKASWLLPYDELAEPDKEADRQIGEYLIEWAKKYTPAALNHLPDLPQAVPQSAPDICLMCKRPLGAHSMDTADICNSFIGGSK